MKDAFVIIAAILGYIAYGVGVVLFVAAICLAVFSPLILIIWLILKATT